MCIIILNKKGLVPKNTLKTCAINNPDGMGIMYAENCKLETFKELKNFELFYSYYENLRKRFKGNICLHFRIKTHGTVSEKNIHPFYINRNLAFMHNGIIDIEPKSDLSDTQVFNEMVLKGLPKNFLSNKSILHLIEKSIGWSKLLFLDNLGNYTLINEKDGIWKDGNWYSNFGYLPEKYSYYENYDYCCELCNSPLLTDYEIEEGYCYECLSRYNNLCQNCNEPLETIAEINKGYCKDCSRLWNEFQPS